MAGLQPGFEVRNLGQLLGRKFVAQCLNRLEELFRMMSACDGVRGKAPRVLEGFALARTRRRT